MNRKIEIKENSYSWSDMANALSSYNIPHEVIRDLACIPLSIALKRPALDIFKFDDFLHTKYGNYENENKSMNDMFQKLFGSDCYKIAYFFGIEKK